MENRYFVNIRLSKRIIVSAVLVFFLLFVQTKLFAQTSPDYSSLKKFLDAKMYTEAYAELLKCEINAKNHDPKLKKLKKDMLQLAKKEAVSRARVQKNDAVLFTVLADIDFNEALVDNGIKNITQAFSGNPNDITHYVFAKLLFMKGNINQSFDQMEKALHLNPASEAIFDDFQFVYHSRAYGVAAAKRLYSNTGFASRNTPVAPKSDVPVPPESPFQNDPTSQATAINPPPPDPDDPEPLPAPSQAIASPIKTVSTPMIDVNKPNQNISMLPDEIPDSPDDLDFKMPDLPQISIASANGSNSPITETLLDPNLASTSKPQITAVPKTDPNGLPDLSEFALTPDPLSAENASSSGASDPEDEKLKELEKLISNAKSKIKDGNLDEAETLLEKVLKANPENPAAKEFQTKISEIRTLEKNFKRGIAFYEQGNYDQAKDDLLKAYESDPKKYEQATFYIGKVLLLGTEKDLAKSREYFEKFLTLSGTDPELKRDVEWVIIGILADEENYSEAYKKFNEFVEREPEYSKNRETYKILKYRLWYRNFQTEILAGIGIFAGAFIMVFFLMFLPAIKYFTFDPLKKAKLAAESGDWSKAAQVAENALRGAKQPVQIERQFLEIAVEANFNLRNYFKCQDHARHLLSLFADNMIAWKYVAQACLKTNDTGDDAISMYETAYKNNPENTEYLEVLAKHYAVKKIYTVETMEVMENLMQINPANRDIAVALAEAYVQNKRMDEKSVGILQQALIQKPGNIPFKELLARTFSKLGKYQEASRECITVLNSNINNMGIHVVYTTCMKKMNMLDEAILRYEEFMKKFPGNPQITEILTGLRKDLEAMGGSVRDSSAAEISAFSEDMVDESIMELPDMPAKKTSSTKADVDSFIEPMPEDLFKKEKAVPIPDFLKKPGDQQQQKASEPAFSLKKTNKPSFQITPTSQTPAPKPKDQGTEQNSTQTNELSEARIKAAAKKWDDVVKLLSPMFATSRKRETGVLLGEAYLNLKSPEMTKEIIDTLELDPELISEEIKDLLYRTAMSLEEKKLFKDALKLYDLICSADINYLDAFDRSDKLYSQVKH
ncbi:MAG: tetratricopeptide repeat protein [Candidatus Riflebacteria bacterium]|nr:tetratricopeptide repeat protein [Candidatus Riflebacteria bacterium]